jgi:RimJ/RimL family protein N-acetyltransferase
VILVDGAVARAPTVTIRPITPDDAPRLERFYASLSDESRNLRFLGWSPGIGTATSRAFCTADHEHREGLVAVVAGPDEGGAAPGELVGHLCIEPDGTGSAEIAVAVADHLQGLGIGRRLVEAGVDWGRRQGLRQFTATAFAWNARIIRLVRGLRLPVRFGVATGGATEMRIDLTTPVPAAA